MAWPAALRSASSSRRISASGAISSIRGQRVGAELAEPAILDNTPRAEKSSIIAVVATDAPLLPHQMKRLARRVPLGVALTGGYGYNSSGDIFLAFSTANPEAALRQRPARWPAPASSPTPTSIRSSMPSCRATEEAILNALVANDDMTGRDGNFVPALPKAWLKVRFGKVLSYSRRGSSKTAVVDPDSQPATAPTVAPVRTRHSEAWPSSSLSSASAASSSLDAISS